MKIAIPISSYMWAGGAELIGNFLTAIKHSFPDTNIYLLYNSNNRSTSKVVRILYSLMLIFKLGPIAVARDIKAIILGSDKFFSIKDFINQDTIFQKLDIIETDFSSESLNEIKSKYKLDIIFAASYPLPKGYSGKWVGYITDIQHRRFKANFTWLESIRRDYIFTKILKNSNQTCVNSFDVKRDLIKYYGSHYDKKITVLPVCPFPRSSWLIDDKTIYSKYKLPKKYFLISSQLWVHKSHLTAFKALKQISGRYPDIHIICTGDTNDYRNPTFFDYLKESITKMGLVNKIRFLGLIPKSDQIQIMRGSIAVLQPSIFEGGPGGGAVQNAISLGVRSIVADIPINKELENHEITYFTAESPQDLAKKMIEVIKTPYKVTTKEVLSKGEKMKLNLGNSIMEVLTNL